MASAFVSVNPPATILLDRERRYAAPRVQDLIFRIEDLDRQLSRPGVKPTVGRITCRTRATR